MKNPFLPPGPRGLPLVGSLFEFYGDVFGFLMKVSEKYGDIVHFKLGKRRMFLLNNPEHIKDVLVTNHRNFRKSRALERSKFVLGEGLLTSEGEQHLKHRRTIQPVFHHKRIQKYGDVMAQYALELGMDWKNGQVLDIHKEMMRLTLAIITKTVLDVDLKEQTRAIGKAITDLVNLFPRFAFPYSELLDDLPLPSNRRCENALSTLNNIVYRMIEERRNDPRGRDDLLTMLLRSQDPENEGYTMSNEEVRDEVMTLFLAGQESMANALSWTWYLVAQHPEVRARLQDELAQVLGGRLPNVTDLGQLRYTEKIFKESLRLYPPAWAVVRRIKEDYQVNGYLLPGGSDIMMSEHVVHRNPKFYDNPEMFNPGRWTNEMEKNLPKFAYFPFGGGPRRCIGEPFAWMEGVLILAAIASRWNLHLVPKQTVTPQPLITTRPKNGLKVIVERVGH